MRYLYFVFSKKIEKELNDRNAKILSFMELDKNGLVKKYFEMKNSKYAEFNWKEFLLNPSENLIEMRRLIEEDFGIRLNTFNESHMLMLDVVEKEKCKSRILQTTAK